MVAHPREDVDRKGNFAYMIQWHGAHIGGYREGMQIEV